MPILAYQFAGIVANFAGPGKKTVTKIIRYELTWNTAIILKCVPT